MIPQLKQYHEYSVIIFVSDQHIGFILMLNVVANGDNSSSPISSPVQIQLKTEDFSQLLQDALYLE